MYIWRHDICHVTASRWCHICQNVSPIPSNRYAEAIFAIGITKKVTGEKNARGVASTPPGRPRVKMRSIWYTVNHASNQLQSVVLDISGSIMNIIFMKSGESCNDLHDMKSRYEKIIKPEMVTLHLAYSVFAYFRVRLFRICLFRIRLFRVRLFLDVSVFAYSGFAYSVFAYSVFAYSVFTYSVFA